jgi:hypothetical protein
MSIIWGKSVWHCADGLPSQESDSSPERARDLRHGVGAACRGRGGRELRSGVAGVADRPERGVVGGVAIQSAEYSVTSESMDEDIEVMSRDQLVAEIRKLRQGIRRHRDSTGHELCWHHPALWSLLPERQDPLPTVPAWPEFLRGCVRYRESLDTQLPIRTDEESEQGP